TMREQRRIVRQVRAVRRLVSVAVWTLVAMVVQVVLLGLPGRAKVHFPRVYWAWVARLLGMRVRVIGAGAGGQARSTGGGTPARPVIFVANHCSWLDIPVLGGRLPGCFVSKDEVGRWPVVSTIARLGRTVFVTRRPGRTADERDVMQARLAAGDNLVLFPEGTSSDGSRVLPFRTSFFAVAVPGGGIRQGAGSAPPGTPAPLIQPVSLVYDRMGWLPTGRATRSIFAWYGDMDLASHFWRLAQLSGLRATVLLHTPVDPASFPDRKALARAVWSAVADGAATLRQNRPARPLETAAAAPGDRPVPDAGA
ncbi:lysophospholipid acyltransferase family protein, partial [Acidisphaera rubrifaciens]|uniref:lysophospholipid acyltransferase family protein n=1 Tax=Acidisphaera rubrifaciens TaxID=50715 RepID=UPI00069BE188